MERFLKSEDDHLKNNSLLPLHNFVQSLVCTNDEPYYKNTIQTEHNLIIKVKKKKMMTNFTFIDN